MGSRIAVSKRARFEVFKRDEFTCQYCGAHPPQAILHVDHIDPVARGGSNDITNLVTACDSCNQGKAAVPLTSVPQSLAQRTVEITEREEQIRGYQSVMAQRELRLETETWNVIHVLKPKARDFPRDWYQGIRRFLEKLDYFTVLGAMENAVCKKPYSERKAFLYFCGTCWRILRGEGRIDG